MTYTESKTPSEALSQTGFTDKRQPSVKAVLGAVHKGRPQRRGRGYGQMRTPADRREGG